MENKYLAYIRSINAVKIFLNIMGFSLDDFNDINVFTKIKIRNKDMKPVGKLSIGNEQLIVKIKENLLSLKATCNISGNTDFWSHNINFECKQKNNVNLSGEFLFSAACGAKYGGQCICMPSIVCMSPDGENIKIKLFHDGKLFSLNYNYLNYSETIDITRGNDNYIRHVIEDNYYDKDKNKWHYKLYAGVFNSPEFCENGDKLHLVFSESINNKTIVSKEDYIEKVVDGKELLMQKGVLMRKLDDTMLERIEIVKKLLLVNDTYLLNNLLGVCLGNYSDFELQALLGITKNNKVYQDGYNSLAEAYFNDKRDIKRKKLTS